MSDAEWVEVVRLKPGTETFRGFVSICFWLWGAAGLAWSLYQFGKLYGDTPVSSGFGDYLSVHLQLWFGGLLFFGLGSIICGQWVSVQKTERSEG